MDIEPTFQHRPGLKSCHHRRKYAIIPVHLYGQMADMDAIVRCAPKHWIPVIEDAAQAIGAEIRAAVVQDRLVRWRVSAFSPKNLGAFGDAGMVTTNGAAMAERVVVAGIMDSAHITTRCSVELSPRRDSSGGTASEAETPGTMDRGRQRNALESKDIRCAQLPVERPGGRHIYNQFRRTVIEARRTGCTSQSRMELLPKFTIPCHCIVKSVFQVWATERGDCR